MSPAGLVTDSVASEKEALTRVGTVDVLALGAGVTGELREWVTAVAAQHGVQVAQGPHIEPERVPATLAPGLFRLPGVADA